MENQAIATTDAPVRLAAALREGARRLRVAGIESAGLDAELLLGKVLELSREQLVLAADRWLSAAQGSAYEQLLARRLDHEPIAYITGRREFWSLQFQVSPAVLIPRPETELLVELALQRAGALGSSAPARIIDIGTGSGAIAVALACELARAEIFATEISAAALAVAAENALRNGVADRIVFRQGDLFAGLSAEPPVDLIVSNPPYVRRGAIAGLEPEISRWEPRGALDGGSDGCDYYRRMAPQAFAYLRPGGEVLVEIGAGMGATVAAIFTAIGGCAEVELHQDYAGNDRVVSARKRI